MRIEMKKEDALRHGKQLWALHGKVQIRCSNCGQRVHMWWSPRGKFHFKHKRGYDQTKCSGHQMR